MKYLIFATLFIILIGCGSGVLSIEDGFLRASQGTSVTGFVLSDDVNSESRLEFYQPEHGSVIDLGNGRFEYLADIGFDIDKFKVRLRNENKISPWAEIKIKIVNHEENTIHNYGVSGYTTNHVLKIIDEIRTNYPDLALIMIGTNDSLGSTNGINISDYEKNLTRIVEYISSSNSSVILMKIPPAISDYILDRHPIEHFSEYGGVNRTIDAYNLIVDKVALEKGLIVYDVNTLVLNNGGVSPSVDSYLRNELNRNSRDGVHLTSEGYHAISEGLFNLIINHNLPHSNIVSIGDSITLGVHEVKGYPDYLRDKLGYN